MIVHSDKLRWLVWLRVTMLIRGLKRRRATLIATIVVMLVLLVVAAFGVLGLFALFQNLSAPANTELLYLLFSAMLLAWILLPLLAYSTNEGLDVTKLQLFPLTRLELMFSLVFSSLFDIWTVLLFVFFAGTVVAWWMQSLALGLITLLVVVVFYAVMVSISQLIVALLMRTLQSRRFRDLSVIIIALFGSSCYFISRLADGLGSYQQIGAMLNGGSFSQYLRWFPSGVAASAIREAVQGDWGGSFALVGLLVLIAAVALYLWQLVLERSMTASETGATHRKQRGQNASARAVVAAQSSARAAAPVRAGASQPGTILFEQISALVRKELTYFWRDPQLKVRMIQMLIPVAILVVFPAFNAANSTGRAAFEAAYTPFVAAVLVFLYMLSFSQNTLGIERQSLTTLVLFPIDRRRLLWGKNLAVFLLGISILIILLIVCVVLAHESSMVLPALIIGLSGMGVALGWGNIASCYFPRYQPQIGRRGYQATGGPAQAGGCMNQVMSLVMTLVTIISLAPVALGIGIPFFLNMAWLLAATIPLSLIYGLVFYVVLTNYSARRMVATEPEILGVITRE